MGATSLGALIGGAIDSMSGDDDSSIDGMIKGAIISNVLKVTLPLVATWAIGWAVLKGVETVAQQVTQGDRNEVKN